MYKLQYWCIKNYICSSVTSADKRRWLLQKLSCEQWPIRPLWEGEKIVEDNIFSFTENVDADYILSEYRDKAGYSSSCLFITPVFSHFIPVSL